MEFQQHSHSESLSVGEAAVSLLREFCSQGMVFRAKLCLSQALVVTGKQQNNSLSKTEVWSFRKQAFFIAALDAQGIAAPKCAY